MCEFCFSLLEKYNINPCVRSSDSDGSYAFTCCTGYVCVCECAFFSRSHVNAFEITVQHDMERHE